MSILPPIPMCKVSEPLLQIHMFLVIIHYQAVANSEIQTKGRNCLAGVKHPARDPSVPASLYPRHFFPAPRLSL